MKRPYESQSDLSILFELGSLLVCSIVFWCFDGYCCLGRVKRVFTQTQLIYTQVWEQGWVAPSYRRHALGNNAVKPVHSGWSFRNARLFSHTSISQILWLQLSNSNSPYESTSINHSATLLFSTPSKPILQEKQNPTRFFFKAILVAMVIKMFPLVWMH